MVTELVAHPRCKDVMTRMDTLKLDIAESDIVKGRYKRPRKAKKHHTRVD